MEDFHKTVAEEYKKGTPIAEIMRLTNRGKNTIFRAAKRLKLTHPNRDNRLHGKIEVDSSLTKGAEAMEPTKRQLAEFKHHCDENGLPFDLWRAFWHKTGQYSSFFVNKEAEAAQQNFRKELLEDIKSHSPKYRKPSYKKLKDPHLQLIDIADLHIGKFAFTREGHVAYDIEKAVEMAHKGVQALLNRAQGFPTEKFIFPIGNDVVHIDNKNSTTTKGTHQDTQGVWWQMVRAAVELYVTVIEQLSAVAPVEVVYNPANHDEHLALHAAEVVQARMVNHSGVTFSINPHKDREYIKYGLNMIGLDHGDGAKMKDVPMLMAAEEPKMWGETLHRFMIRHHVHHWQKTQFLTGEDFPGVTVQYMRSLSASDDWHQKKGFVGAPQAVDSFIYHPEYGQVDHMSAVFAKSMS